MDDLPETNAQDRAQPGKSLLETLPLEVLGKFSLLVHAFIPLMKELLMPEFTISQDKTSSDLDLETNFPP